MTSPPDGRTVARVRVRTRTVVALLLTVLAWLSDALAADVTGTWDLVPDSVAAQTWTITAGTGTLAGECTGGSYTWPIEGTLTGSAVRITTAYRETSYTAYFVGTVSADGATMSGTQVHAVRLPGYQLGVEVIFGADGQRLHLKHEAGDGSKPYVAGALLAIRKVHTVRGVVRGLDKVMEGL